MSLLLTLADAAAQAASATAAIGFSAIGSAYGAGAAACSAVGAWKKCYMQNKPAPFQLLIFAGAPLSQTIYGMILMFIIMGTWAFQIFTTTVTRTMSLWCTKTPTSILS